MNGEWKWGSDSPVWMNPRRSVFFIYRRANGKTEHLQDKRGRNRYWRSMEAVRKALAILQKP